MSRSPPKLPARLERAVAIAAQGNVRLCSNRRTTYDVRASDGSRTYRVHLSGPRRCNCPDAQYRALHCKHYLAAALVHLIAIARGDETELHRTFKQAAPRRWHPLWYEVS